MRIRPANENDIPELVKGCRGFYEEFLRDTAPYYSEDSATAMMRHLTTHPDGLILLLEDEQSIQGGIGGQIAPWMLDFSTKIMMEIFWWVYPEKRGRGLALLKRFEEEAKRMRADMVLMVMLHHDDSDVLSDYYGRSGYKRLETHFVKEI